MNVRRRRFADGLLAGKTQSEAYVAAGYKCKATSVACNASELAANPEITQYLHARRAKVEAKVEVTAAEIITELRRLALADLSQAYDEHGKPRPLSEIPEDVRRAMIAIDTEERAPGLRMDQNGDVTAPESCTVVKKYRFHSKDRALELLGKHLRMFVDRVEHTVDESLVERLTRARERGKPTE